MELTGPADDLAEFKELVSLGFQPFIRGHASYAFAFYATYHEACRWARENTATEPPYLLANSGWVPQWPL